MDPAAHAILGIANAAAKPRTMLTGPREKPRIKLPEEAVKLIQDDDVQSSKKQFYKQQAKRIEMWNKFLGN